MPPAGYPAFTQYLQSGRVRDFQVAIQEVLDGVSTKYSQQLASLMTLNFQQFHDDSLMAA